MIHAHIDSDKAVPLWAAIGAPLIGVPLMVALLALVSPTSPAPAGEPESVYPTEQVQTVEQTMETGCLEQALRNG